MLSIITITTSRDIQTQCLPSSATKSSPQATASWVRPSFRANDLPINTAPGLTINGERGPSDEAGITALEAAYAEGIYLWNAGEFYGPPHRNSLQLLNKYFTKHPDHASNVVLSVKGGTIPGTMDFDGSRENTTRSIEECLKQLDGKKKLDIFEAARVDPKIPIEKATEVIAEYVKAGKIGGISLSECSAESIRRAVKVHKIECVEVEFSLWATEILDNGVAKTCADLGIPVIAYSPLGRGFLVSCSS